MTKDVTIRIETRKAARLVGLGKPLILVQKTGASTIEDYTDATTVATAFGADSAAHKLAIAVSEQGDTSPATFAVATYDAASTDGPKTAAEAATLYYDEDWYFVVSDAEAIADKMALANVVEGQGVKMHGTTVKTQADYDQLEAQEYRRTFAIVHPTALVAEGMIGAVGSLPAGSVTWKFAQVVGVPRAEYEFEGETMQGEYVDIVHFADWIVINGAQAIQTLLETNRKIPYTDEGFVQLALALENVLKAATNNGGISITDGTPDYTIDFVNRINTNPADRAERVYNGLSFTFTPSGAIHKANVIGQMIF